MCIRDRPAMYRKFFLSSYGVDIEKLFFDVDDWRKRTITIPSLDEQGAVGSWFRSLDRMIELHQQKHEKLVRLKQSMLQKMFPKDGATAPEIRFSGFSEQWTNNSLDQFFTERDGRSGDGELISVTLHRGVIKASDSGRADTSSRDRSNYKIVKAGDIAYNSMRMWLSLIHI